MNIRITDEELCLITFFLGSLIFLIDINIPLGVAGGVPYILLILLSVWSSRPGFTIFMAVLASVLTVAGYFISPPGGELWKVLANRFLALFAIWATALLTMYWKKSEEKVKYILESEHNESEEVGRLLLASSNVFSDIGSCYVEVIPSSRVSGDRAGFLLHKEKNDIVEKKWLVVLDASGHGKGAASFQEVAIGALLALLDNGMSMGEGLSRVNQLLSRLESGRFIVGNIWRIVDSSERAPDEGYIWVEEFNIGQHPVIVYEPDNSNLSRWEWGRSDGKSMPLGLFDDGLTDIRPVDRKVKKGSRIVTFTDGATEVMNSDGTMFGLDRFAELIRNTASMAPKDAHQGIISGITHFTERAASASGVFEDDVTIAIYDVF